MASHSFYQPLDPSRREIRLIEIASFDPCDKSDVISCQLHVVSLIDKPYFVALSYVWGDPKDTIEILVNGTPIQATINLAGALRQAVIHAPKHIPSEDDSAWTDIESDDDGDFTNGDAPHTAPTAGDWSALRFWADAVCINQEDTDEKNHQIPLMKDIYSGARLVVGSLGHGEDPKLDLALKGLKDLFNVCDRNIIPQYEQDTLRQRTSFSNLAPGTLFNADNFNLAWLQSLPYLHAPPSSVTHPCWESVVEVALNPYFKRVWIIQEMTLARNLVLMSDGHSFNPDEHAVAINMLMGFAVTSKARLRLTSRDKWPRLHLIGDPLHVLGMRVLSQSLLTEGSVWHTQQLGLAARATDLRDHVYGMLGISGIDLEVDYAKSAADVYADMTRECIRTGKIGHLDNFLGLAGIGLQSYTRELPSWTPCPAREGQSRISAVDVDAAAGVFSGAAEASGATGKLGVLAVSHGCMLSTTGVRFDQVSRCRTIPNLVGSTEDEERLAFMEWNINRQLLTKAQGKSWAEVMLRALLPSLAGALKEWAKPKDGIATDELITAATREVLAVMLAPLDDEGQIKSDRHLDVLGQAMNNLSQTRRLSSLGNEWADEIRFTICYYLLRLEDQCLFETEGGYLGRGPRGLLPRDIVCVLKGSRLPVLLRRDGEDYLHVGVCWIPGLMDGKIIRRLVRKGDAMVERLVLK
ncbi:hypothetical protein MAPG_00232 [Magnaporthiopsis poae ATCC 64411]|uniref:Heterokaryon incompatibility domain-containing protein n=1 Tax=Magnaporthiopsis poae (strain ATCC 64411 / 73-15) TaxID=644358 RepID=A0A0C4DKG1_MAGP6|nr:hypothetical protein MAPG_00232 [Magnaporthiopsis poae ATCC 64411]